MYEVDAAILDKLPNSDLRRILGQSDELVRRGGRMPRPGESETDPAPGDLLGHSSVRTN